MKIHVLTHCGRVTHICVSNLTIIGSNNDLSPSQCQAIIWTNAGILLIRLLGTNFSEMLMEIHTFSFKKIHLKMSSGKWRPFCLCLNVLSLQLPASHEYSNSRPTFVIYVIIRITEGEWEVAYVATGNVKDINKSIIQGVFNSVLTTGQVREVTLCNGHKGID